MSETWEACVHSSSLNAGGVASWSSRSQPDVCPTPPPCWEDRSAPCGRLRRRKQQAWNALQNLQASTPVGTRCVYTRTPDRQVSRRPRVFSGSKLLLPNGQPALKKCDSYPICGRRMIFSCCKSSTTLSCHASQPRCQNAKRGISTDRRGQLWMFHVKRWMI